MVSRIQRVLINWLVAHKRVCCACNPPGCVVCCVVLWCVELLPAMAASMTSAGMWSVGAGITSVR